MASKAKIQRLRLENRRRLIKRNWFWFVFVIPILLAVLFFVSFWQTSGMRITSSSWLSPATTSIDVALEKVIRARIEFEMGKILGSSDTAQRLPVALKQRVSELLERNRRGTLMLEVSRHRNGGDMYSMMACDCGADVAVSKIVFFGPHMYDFMNRMKPDEFSSQFAVYLYHETVHLEKSSLLPVLPTIEQTTGEEARAYGRTSLEVVRPMRRAGFWMTYEMIEIDDILQGCSDSFDCPRYLDKIRQQNRGSS